MLDCKCSYYIGCKHPCIGGSGSDHPDVLLVGESPGLDEDKLGECFRGPTGKLLRATTDRVQCGAVRYTNAVRCFSKNPKLAVPVCRHFLEEEIARTDPKRIIALGATATQSIFGVELPVTHYSGAWGFVDIGGAKRVCQIQIHPSAALRNPSFRPEWTRQYTEALASTVPPSGWVDLSELDIITPMSVDDAVCFLRDARKSKLVAYDTEYNPSNGAFLCYSIATDANSAIIIHSDLSMNPRVVQGLKALFADSTVRKVAHNWKFDAHVSCNTFGFDTELYLTSQWLDTSSLAKIDDPERDGRLEVLEWHVGLGGHKSVLYAALGSSKNGNSYEKLYRKNPKLVGWYCAVDAIACWRLVPTLWGRLKRRNMTDLWKDAIGPVGPVLFDLERSGIKIDREALVTLDSHLSTQKQIELSAIRSSHAVSRIAAAGKIPSAEEFNPASSRHVQALMYSDEGLNLKPLEKTAKGAPKVDRIARTAHDSDNPVLARINEYARVEKLANTYVDGWGRRLRDDDTLHTSYRQDGAKTFRFTSSNPNLQTIPRGTNEEALMLRKLVIAFSDDESLLKVDSSQAELRMLAMESGDPELIRCYRERIDVHTRTAAAIRGCSMADVSKQDRQGAKPINFGVIYGMREDGLISYAKNDYGVVMSMEEAGEALRKYFKLYPEVLRYQAKLLAECRRTGVVWINWCGKKVACRPIPDIGSSERGRRGGAERIARNTPIQGGAMQYTTRSMVAIHQRIRGGSLEGVLGMIGTVHDDIWFRVVRGKESVAFRAIGKVIVSLPTIRGVPWEVEGSSGPNLAEMKTLGTVNSMDI